MKKQGANSFIIQVALVVVFFIGLMIMLYPFYVEAVNNFIDEVRINQAKQFDQKKNRAQLAELKKENEAAAQKAAKDPFKGTGKMTAKKLKKHLLGRVVIPKIKVNVPLFNLTTSDTLEYGAAVLQGSSFPEGGKGKRTIIAAHRGLPERKLFTDLNRVKKGDIFVINVFGKNLAYRVINIKVVKPKEINAIRPVAGMDLATLMTCTPYMINTHRMLVTGYRVPYTKKIAQEVNQAALMNRLIQAAVLLGCVLAVAGFVILVYRIIHQGLLKKKRIDIVFNVPKAGSYQLLGKNGRHKLYRQGGLFVVQAKDHQVTFADIPGGIYTVKALDGSFKVRFGIKKLKQQKARPYLTRKQQKAQLFQKEAGQWLLK